VLALCFEACWFGELSQQPICPHSAHLRRCSHHPPVARQSTQPVLDGFDAFSQITVSPCSFVIKLTVVVYMYVEYQFARSQNSVSWGTNYFQALACLGAQWFHLITLLRFTLRTGIKNNRFTTTMNTLSKVTFFGI
jgi:hypothetical protein